MYAHKLARFYYTTYDVRRSEDVINPRTSHCDVMLLGPQAEGMSEETPPHHRFLYARVLGIYHVNVVYTGPGMVSYEPMKFNFLWVRWFNVSLDATYSIKRLRRAARQAHLDCLTFPPMAADDAFGFVDPELVLRGCHLLPMFSQGKCLKDGVGLSKLARDNQDWKYYFVNQYV